MSPLDDLVFQYPMYGIAILPHVFDFIAPGMCTSWTSLSASLASRAWVQPGTHAFDWAQQVSHYGNMTLVTLATPSVDAARGLATRATGLSPDMSLDELEAWLLAASLPQTASLPAAPAQLRSTIVDPHANPADDAATGEPASAAGTYILRANACTARLYICHPRATTLCFPRAYVYMLPARTNICYPRVSYRLGGRVHSINACRARRVCPSEGFATSAR